MISIGKTWKSLVTSFVGKSRENRRFIFVSVYVARLVNEAQVCTKYTPDGKTWEYTFRD